MSRRRRSDRAVNPPDPNGFSTGTIHISGVPTDADIVAAYLYWETITLTADLSQADGVTFRGEEIILDDVAAVKKSTEPARQSRRRAGAPERH